MAFNGALRAAMAQHLGIDEAGIATAEVTWDDGDRYDPTYGDSPNAVPTFEVTVTTTDGQTHTADTAWTFSALLTLALSTGI